MPGTYSQLLLHVVLLLCPSRGRIETNNFLHGLRCAPPVATSHGPAGADGRHFGAQEANLSIRIHPSTSCTTVT